MDSKLLDAAATLVGSLGHSRTGFSHFLVHHIEKKRFQPEEVSVRSRFRCTVRSDQCFVSLHILARAE